MNLHAYLKLVEDRALPGGLAPAETEETIRLYHGTSDILADEIEQFGFMSSGGEDAYQFLRDLAKRAVKGELSRELVRALREHARGYLKHNSIFFTPTYEIAVEHARLHAKNGGEIGGEVAEILKDVLGMETTLFDHAAPVVITVEIPRSWVPGEIRPNQYEVVVHHATIDPRYIIGVERV